MYDPSLNCFCLNHCKGVHEMSAIKNLVEEAIEYLNTVDTEYCCYCGERRDSKWSCCGENHFETFKDMDKENQQVFIDEYLAGDFYD